MRSSPLAKVVFQVEVVITVVVERKEVVATEKLSRERRGNWWDEVTCFPRHPSSSGGELLGRIGWVE